MVRDSVGRGGGVLSLLKKAREDAETAVVAIVTRLSLRYPMQ